nr:relaxase/mobilization nuclease domain-containing protein [Nostoc sp. ChiQUE02]MDZ8233983.1 relaxase/mobilization nuclease domain-containing protein [Nostoc sp. ChiQUE02]
MITKVKANKSFRGTTKYVLEKEKAKIIGGNMYGKSTNELVEQFTLSAHLNPQLKDPCYHLMLSVPKTDRTLNDDELANLSQRHLASVIVLSRLKGEESQVKQPDKRIADTKLRQLVDDFIETELPAYDFFIARHSDKEHDHTHIVASRINNLDGKSIRTWNNYAHSEHSARLLEREFQLTQIQTSWESKQKAMTRNQLERVERDGLPGEEIMRRAIEQLAADKPIMPQFIERLWREHQVKSIVSYYGYGGIRGIKFGIDIGSVNEDDSPRLLWKQGGNLNKYKCSFTKLQTELGINYDPLRDDSEIKRLNEFLESGDNNQINRELISKQLPIKTPIILETKAQRSPAKSDPKQRAGSELINAISDFIEQSVVELALAETLPQLIEQVSAYQQQLANNKTAFDDLGAAIDRLKEIQRSQKAVDAISNFIEQSVVDDALAETLPQLTEQLSQYRQQLLRAKTAFNDFETGLTTELQSHAEKKAILSIFDYIEQSAIEPALSQAVLGLTQQVSQYHQQLLEAKTTFNDFETALTTELQSHAEKKAILSIFDYIEQSAIKSALTETVLGLTEQISQYKEQQSAVITTFDDLKAVIVYLEQLHSEQRTVDANALNNAQTPTTDKPKLTPNQTAELYKYYSTDLQNLLVTDRDKEIAKRALLDNKPAQEVEEILKASPAEWTTEEAKALVLIANNQLANQESQPEQLDQEQYLQSEFLAYAVPIAVKLINWQLRESGENNLRFKHSTLSKQGKELVFTHDERGEIFRVAVNRNQSGELEYSPIYVGEIEKEDIQLWSEAERILQQIIEQSERQEIRHSKGISLGDDAPQVILS